MQLNALFFYPRLSSTILFKGTFEDGRGHHIEIFRKLFNIYRRRTKHIQAIYRIWIAIKTVAMTVNGLVWEAAFEDGEWVHVTDVCRGVAVVDRWAGGTTVRQVGVSMWGRAERFGAARSHMAVKVRSTQSSCSQVGNWRQAWLGDGVLNTVIV